MDFAVLLPLLAMFTLLAVIVFAMWSKSRTDKMLKEGRPHNASPLARETEDPKFKPDTRVTDPEGVTS